METSIPRMASIHATTRTASRRRPTCWLCGPDSASEHAHTGKRRIPMRKLRGICFGAVLVVTVCVGAWAGPVKVIANPSVKTDSISADELKSVFLEESSSLSDGSHVEPVLAKGGAAHDA